MSDKNPQKMLLFLTLGKSSQTLSLIKNYKRPTYAWLLQVYFIKYANAETNAVMLSSLINKEYE